MKLFPLFLLLTNFAMALSTLPGRAETAMAPEVSPPGDIPDNQVFVTYASPLGYALKVPEGWARKDEGAKTTFSDKYNHILLQQADVAQSIDENFAKSVLVPDLQKSGRAVDHVKVKTLTLNSGPVVVVEFDSNSEPNAVTNKQVREENESIYFTHNGKLVTLTLSAPKGADNVDQWNFMANSFRWK